MEVEREQTARGENGSVREAVLIGVGLSPAEWRALRAFDSEIEAATRQLPRELAQLPAKDAACLRDTLRGLQAVALARRGELEAGLHMVEGRSLDQRQFCWIGKGYDSKPIFDVRYLVQEWVRRGHAAP